MVKTSEGTFAVDGQELYTKTWLPDGPPVAKLIVVHGFSDHVNNYVDFFPTLASRGIAVYGFDQRGWGRSVHKSSDKGRTGPTETVIGDIVAFIRPHLQPGGNDKNDKNDKNDDDGLPVFVLGHSMGGNEIATLMAATLGSAHETAVVRHVRGWLLEAPFFGFPAGETPSALKITAGRLAGRLLPHFQLKHVIPKPYLTRDPDILARLCEDPLCHDTGTLEGLSGLLDRVNDIAQGRVRPTTSVKSVWLGHGDADRCTDFVASKRWFDTATAAVPDKTFRCYSGWLHMLHAEPKAERELFYRECGDWILERAGHNSLPAKAVDAPAAAAEPRAAAISTPSEEDSAVIAPTVEANPKSSATEAKL
ncbi:hypothetical protein SEPCBS57363_004107 [Sporothrix epigloea]|uniref:Serine aminopeptidase S33 domain-containing protein n=1 Tax=Sporothrix epigloea TaxID=1892477 RepID=A0ABP0DQ84_9PEZI